MRTFAQRQNQPQDQTSFNLTRAGMKSFATSHEIHAATYLQRTVDGQEGQGLLRTCADTSEVSSNSTVTTGFTHDFSRIPMYAQGPINIQPKLVVSNPGDVYEQEADHIAEHVMRMPEHQLQRSCQCGGECPGCKNEQAAHERLQTKPVQSKDSGEIVAPPIVNEVLHSPGQPLDPSTRAFMEPRFGHDFSHVRVHSDAAAAASAKSVNAKAFTVSNAIVFGANQYSPASIEGRRLLAHELAHVVQQAEPRRQRLHSSLPAYVAQPSPDRLFRDEDKTVLEKEGISDKRIVDEAGEVQRIIIDTLSNPNSKLFPYIKDKLKRLKEKTKFNIVDPAEFASEYRKHAKRRNFKIDPSVKDEALVQEIGGFFDPSLNAVFLKTRSNYCHAFHETIHSFSSPDYLIIKLGKDLMEGLTQYFTDVVFEEQVGDVCHTHKYVNQVACAKKLVTTADFDLVAKVFFLIDAGKVEDVAKKLGLKDSKELEQLGSDGICKKLSSPL